MQQSSTLVIGEAGVREEEDEFEWAGIVEECVDSIWIPKRLRRALGIDLSIPQPAIVQYPSHIGKVAEANSKV